MCVCVLMVVVAIAAVLFWSVDGKYSFEGQYGGNVKSSDVLVMDIEIICSVL